jgi:versiconal hemiacetal acetate esterase
LTIVSLLMNGSVLFLTFWKLISILTCTKAWNNAKSIGGDQSKVFTIGASAGGGLALTVADQMIKANKGSQVQGVVAMVPVAAHPESIPSEYKDQYTAYDENGSGVPVIDAESMRIFFEAAGANYHDEKVFVTLSKNLAKFPPTYIATCGKDPLRDDGNVLHAMLKQAGVKTKLDFYAGLPHYFWIFPDIKSRERFLGNVVKGAQWILSA